MRKKSLKVETYFFSSVSALKEVLVIRYKLKQGLADLTSTSVFGTLQRFGMLKLLSLSRAVIYLTYLRLITVLTGQSIH